MRRNARGSGGATGGAASGVQIQDAPSKVIGAAVERALPIHALPAQSASAYRPVLKVDSSFADPRLVTTSSRQS